MTGKEVERTLYSEIAGTSYGRQELAAARATNTARILLQQAFLASNLKKQQLADALRVPVRRVSRVLGGEGNLRVVTLARYMSVMGYRLELSAEPDAEGRPSLARAGRRRSVRADLHHRRVISAGAEVSEMTLTAVGAPVGGDDPRRLGEYQKVGSLDLPQTSNRRSGWGLESRQKTLAGQGKR